MTTPPHAAALIDASDRSARQAEHVKIAKRLTRKISALRTKMKALPTLAEKIAAQTEVKAAEKALRQHRLSYFDFLDGLQA